MPTSTYAQISTVVRYLETVMPTTVLDVGLGNGKLGFIVRDLLDVMHGERYRREEWQVRIDGIEAFPDYVQAHKRAIYDDIHIGDAFDVIDLGTYDVILLGDVLEHFERSRAEQFLEKCRSHCQKAIILCIPLSERWTQEDIYNNSFERHLSFWSPDDFAPRATEIQLLESTGLRQYGVFLMQRDDFAHHEARQRADEFANRGKLGDAVASLETSFGTLPPRLDNSLLLVELLVRNGEFERALGHIQNAERHFPTEQSLQVYGTQLTELVAAHREATGSRIAEAG